MTFPSRVDYPEPTVPGPGRRTHLRRDERRDQILDCALAVFARKGFHETSIAAICAPARIARGTLYQYFSDKRDVLAALIERIVGRIIDAVQQWPRFELPPDMEWTAEQNIAFVEGRCLQIMSVVFADADTASLILRMARGTGSPARLWRGSMRRWSASSRRTSARPWSRGWCGRLTLRSSPSSSWAASRRSSSERSMRAARSTSPV